MVFAYSLECILTIRVHNKIIHKITLYSGLAFAFHVEFSIIFKITLCSKNQHEMTCFFSCNLRSTKKQNWNHLSNFSKWQATKRQSHTHLFCTLHSLKEQNWNNSSHFSKWQGTQKKEKQSHAHTQNFKSLLLFF
jgi:sarcosine oxidase delta subunit